MKAKTDFLFSTVTMLFVGMVLFVTGVVFVWPQGAEAESDFVWRLTISVAGASLLALLCASLLARVRWQMSKELRQFALFGVVVAGALPVVFVIYALFVHELTHASRLLTWSATLGTLCAVAAALKAWGYLR